MARKPKKKAAARKPQKKAVARKPQKKASKPTKRAPRKPKNSLGVTGGYPPDRRAEILKRMNARHSEVTLHGVIERPEFALTTDLRATSDPLWQQFARFRMRLMKGGTYTPADWQSLLSGIRIDAHAAGLRPNLGTVEWIVASLSEAAAGDPSGGWSDEPDAWSKVILTEAGDAGWIETHDYLDGFADPEPTHGNRKRLRAIEWAESWMNARERQLSEMPKLVVPVETFEALLAASKETEKPNGENDDFRKGEWFRRATKDGISADQLRKAAMRGRLLQSKKSGDNWLHSISEVCKRHPEHARRIQEAHRK